MRATLWIAAIFGVLLVVFNGLLPARLYSFNGMAVGVLLVCIGLLGLAVTRKGFE